MTRATGKLHPAEQYVADILEARIPACKWVRMACERYRRDIADGGQRGLHFDEAAAQHALNFFPLLRHSKGEWAGQQFRLEPWQQFTIWSLFGWKRADGTRRFRTAYATVGRKNGKSTEAAGIGLYLFCPDGEPGAEVYSAATKRDQARIVHSEAIRMVRASPTLRKRIRIFRDNLHIPNTASKFEPLGADEDTLDGLNIHGAIVDELHAHKTRKTWDAIDTATGARRQPLKFAITTAGYDRETICWHVHQHAQKVLDRIIEDDSFFALIYTLDEADDWRDEANWIKANPNLGITVKIEEMREQAARAEADPAALNAFLRLKLNCWTQQDIAWMPMDAWRACQAEFTAADMLGEPCFLGLDLATRCDLTAQALLFPPHGDRDKYRLLVRCWVPADQIRRRVERDAVPYDAWARAGYLETTEGNVVDYEVLRAAINEADKQFKVQEIGVDPHNASYLSTQLQADGFIVVDVRQGFLTMSGPTKELMYLVLQRKIEHDGSPLLTWCMSNIMAEQDAAGNIKPSKARSKEKIDAGVASIIALSRAMVAVPGESIYDSRPEVLCV